MGDAVNLAKRRQLVLAAARAVLERNTRRSFLEGEVALCRAARDIDRRNSQVHDPFDVGVWKDRAGLGTRGRVCVARRLCFGCGRVRSRRCVGSGKRRRRRSGGFRRRRCRGVCCSSGRRVRCRRSRSVRCRGGGGVRCGGRGGGIGRRLSGGGRSGVVVRACRSDAEREEGDCSERCRKSGLRVHAPSIRGGRASGVRRLAEAAEEIARDDQLLNLARPLVDFRDFCVTVVALDRKLRRIAVAAVDLDGFRRVLAGRRRRE
jgi:hypothetical protein